ncbi:hypothetical protein GJ496_004895 [Pomphorhynchus laevis]|nr:hypothetical protein GJ496_004895 [Pomphorhynchus laevis]
MAVGGWNMGSPPFETITNSNITMQKFVHSVLRFLQKYNLDGLDLDWEYPVGRKREFTNLCQLLRLAFNPYNHLLTAAVSAGTSNVENYYEPRKLYQLLDFINIMTYDFHGEWDTSTQGVSHHSPLNPRSDEKDWVRDFNVVSYIHIKLLSSAS